MIVSPLNLIQVPLCSRQRAVEVEINNIGRNGQNKIPTVNELNGVLIQQIVSSNRSSISYAPSGRQVVTPNEMANMFITLVDTYSVKVVENMPLIELTTAQTGGYPRYIDPFEIDWDQSYITVGSAGVVSPGQSVILLFGY
jgi:hypothetical protein